MRLAILRSPAHDLAAIERTTQEVGRYLFEHLEVRRPSLWDRRWWDGGWDEPSSLNPGRGRRSIGDRIRDAFAEYKRNTR